MSACRSCGAPVWWAVSESTGRFMPVDADPTPDGVVERTGRMQLSRQGTPVPVVRVVPGAQQSLLDDAPDRYRPHHATCPDADQWRSQ